MAENSYIKARNAAFSEISEHLKTSAKAPLQPPKGERYDAVQSLLARTIGPQIYEVFVAAASFLPQGEIPLGDDALEITIPEHDATDAKAGRDSAFIAARALIETLHQHLDIEIPAEILAMIDAERPDNPAALQDKIFQDIEIISWDVRERALETVTILELRSPEQDNMPLQQRPTDNNHPQPS